MQEKPHGRGVQNTKGKMLFEKGVHKSMDGILIYGDDIQNLLQHATWTKAVDHTFSFLCVKVSRYYGSSGS